MYETALSSVLWFASWPVFIIVCTVIISSAVRSFEKKIREEK